MEELLNSICLVLGMGLFDALKRMVGLGGGSSLSAPKSIAVSSSSSPFSSSLSSANSKPLTGNAVKQTENYLLYAEHMLEYSRMSAERFRVMFDKTIKNEHRTVIVETLIKKFDSFVLDSYFGSLKKLRNNPGLTGIRFSKILPSEIIERNYFNLLVSRLNSKIDMRGNNNFNSLIDPVHEGLDRIITNCNELLSECKNMHSDKALAGEAKRIQDIALQTRVSLAKHTREILALQTDLSKTTDLNILTKMQRLEGGITNAIKFYTEFEASFSTARVTHPSVLAVLSYLEQTNKLLAYWGSSFGTLRTQLRGARTRSGADIGLERHNFVDFAERFCSDVKARDVHLSDLVDKVTFKSLTNIRKVA